MTDAYAVMGHPIAHSKSPLIHSLFAAATSQDLTYQAIHVPPGAFTEAMETFRREGGKGLNITLPFKQEAFRLSGTRSHRATRAGTVNTIWFDADGRPVGDNTDGAGLAVDLTRNLSIRIQNSRVLLVGAGGAARACLPALLDEVPKQVIIANRTHSKAEVLARDFADQGDVRALEFPNLAGEAVDIIINATAASLANDVPPLPEKLASNQAVCYDMMYADQDTPFMAWARQNGAGLVTDGLGMLVEQAAEAFFKWRGIRPETAEILQILRAP